MRFRAVSDFPLNSAGIARVLARIDDGAPSIIERGLGAGRVVVLNTGGGDRWSDLARRKSFVPFVDRLLTHLASTGLRRNFAVGEVVTLSLNGWQSGEKVTVKTPADRRFSPALRPAGEGRAILSFEAEEG